MADGELIPIAAFAGFACGTYVLLRTLDPQRRRVAARVEELMLERNTATSLVGARSGPTGPFLPRAMDLFHRVIPNRAADCAGIRLRLIKAGIYSPGAVSRFIAFQVALATVPALAIAAVGYLGYLAMPSALLLGLAAGCFGAVIPGLWITRQIGKRHLTFRRSLPDFLDLMIVCLEGGLSLQETIRRVSDELQLAHPTLAYELGVVQRDIEIGATLEQALKRFAVRSDYEGARTLSTFIREAQRFGTNITEALRSHADMLRSQREQAAEENAQKAAVKILLPTLLLIFPAIFVVLVGPAIIQIQEAFAKQ